MIKDTLTFTIKSITNGFVVTYRDTIGESEKFLSTKKDVTDFIEKEMKLYMGY